jgi:para-aminobenzoate synthetase component 1
MKTMENKRKLRAYVETLPMHCDPWEAYQRIAVREEQRYSCLLESGRGGRYSFLCVSPQPFVEWKDGRFTQFEAGRRKIRLAGDGRGGVPDPLAPIRRQIAEHRGDPVEGLPFSGGWIGCFSYDWVRLFETLPSKAQKDLDLPEMFLLYCNQVVVFDHARETITIVVSAPEGREASVLARQRVRQIVGALQAPRCQRDNGRRNRPAITAGSRLSPEYSMNRDAFLEAVIRIREYIQAGDVFQVNVSLREGRQTDATPEAIYGVLRTMNPSPYMAFVRTPEWQLVSCSPELLVKKRGAYIETRPIAGTRPRGRSEAEDLALEQELLHNEKEKAEHIMLVDLERNDIGRVAKFGTVRVEKLMAVERYSHVMHLVSRISGVLDGKFDALDVLRACFPGGTITGAPKVRTMEIIEELEPVRRGFYTGSLGWIGWNGDMEFNILIRTMILTGGMAYVQAGAGIVFDSDPEREYEESLQKAAVLWRAWETAERQAGEGGQSHGSGD